MSCWEVLGLTPDADTRSIKRRYAALLKHNRPDDNPAGFQRLREAYERALQGSQVDAPLATPQPSINVVQPAAQRSELAAALVADVTSLNVPERYQQACDAGCAEAFEALLLERCLTQPEPALAQWAINRLHWLSPWQRASAVRLPQPLLDALLSRMFADLGQSLGDLLQQQQVNAFNDVLIDLKQAEWLKPLERHERLNALLANTLVGNPFWSTELFETLCTQQGWSSRDHENRCPEPQWSHLQARHDLEAFTAQLQHAASLDIQDSPHRAAKLLMGQMTLAQRKRFARRFGESDWFACHQLSEKLLNRYPALCVQMPGGDPFFWRGWERAGRPWPMFVALLGMAVAWALQDQWSSAHSLMETLGMAFNWTLLIATPALVILAIWLPATEGYGSVDEQLAARVAPWLSFRRPAPLVIREILPCGLLGLVIWIVLGIYPLIGYMATLHALGLAQRVAGWPAVRQGCATYLPPWRLKVIGICLLVLLVVAGGMHYNHRPVERNEGLQPFLMRPCSGLSEGCSS